MRRVSHVWFSVPCMMAEVAIAATAKITNSVIVVAGVIVNLLLRGAAVAVAKK